MAIAAARLIPTSWTLTQATADWTHPLLSMKGKQELFFVTGEPSGDLHAALLAEELARQPNLQFTGAGGVRMKQAGVALDADSAEWGSVGIATTLRRVPYLLAQKQRLLNLIVQRQPALLILVDFGAFNVRLARSVKQRCPQQRIMYYFPPSSWQRQPRDWSFLAQLTDLVATPFEWSAQNLRACGVKADWVGHPVVDRISPPADRAQFRQQHGLPQGRPVIGLMPGSRAVERRCMGPQLLRAAAVIRSRLPEAHFLWSAWPPNRPGRWDRAAGTKEYITCAGDSQMLIMACDLVIAASGTATLEAAAAGCPVIMVYRGTWPMVIQYWCSDLGTRFYAMPNIVAEREIVPELLQWDVNPQRVAAEVLDLWGEPRRWEQMKRDLAEVRTALGPPGASRRVAELVGKLLGLASGGADGVHTPGEGPR